MEDVTPSTKRCSRCSENLPREAFNLNRHDKKTGLTSRCRSCDSDYKKEHRAKYPERHRAANAAKYARDRDRILAAQREYHNRPEVRERHVKAMRDRYWADPDATRAKSRAYRAANRETVKAWKRAEYERAGYKKREYMRLVYAANPEKIKAAVLAWARANPDSVNERNRRHRARRVGATIGVITPTLLLAKAEYWGRRCWMCGKVPDTWDHVKPLSRGGPHMLANLRPACWACNSSKAARWPFPLIKLGVTACPD